MIFIKKLNIILYLKKYTKSRTKRLYHNVLLRDGSVFLETLLHMKGHFYTKTHFYTRVNNKQIMIE